VSDAVLTTAPNQLIAPVAITDHQADIYRQPRSLLPESLPEDPGLTAVVEAWGGLPDSVRAAITALIRTDPK
jgi:hypothetical protein